MKTLTLINEDKTYRIWAWYFRSKWQFLCRLVQHANGNKVNKFYLWIKLNIKLTNW